METVAAIVSLVSLAAKAAPLAETVYADGAKLISTLFSKGVISIADQNAYMAWSDAHQAATLAGQEPPEFVVS
jgi:hypothetical protein